MRVLCTGIESSGTKLCTDLLRKAGADAVHSSPNHRKRRGEFPHEASGFDAVVLVIRNWFAQTRSAVEHGHANDFEDARLQTFWGLSYVLFGLSYGGPPNLYVVTYESLVSEPRAAFGKLCQELGLEEPEGYEIGDGNAKYIQPGNDAVYFRDQRELHER